MSSKAERKPAAGGKALARLVAASPFVEQASRRDPGWAQWLKAGGLEAPFKPGAIGKALRAATQKTRDEAAFMRALRELRMAQMARVAARALAGKAPLAETLEAVSELADAACAVALGFAERALQNVHGVPRDESGAPVAAYILGMGKLGGRELNFSSDIDLILGYSANGETDGRAPIATEQYFERLARLFTRLLADRTPEGFVFRVDWMLRPFGASGPPAMASGAMEEYYQVSGREWERYALIKARVVAGDAAAGEALLKALRPFVYRRYLDFNAIGALRDMKRMINAEVQRKELHGNIKLGAGGIREIEFIGQAFQLMRGGREGELRNSQLLPVLEHLGRAGYLPAATVARLRDCYELLRRVENAIQMREDEQRHALPDDAAAREALAAALGFAGAGALEARLAETRAFVQAEFGRLFAEPGTARDEHGLGSAVAGVWRGDAAVGLEALKRAGFADDAEALREAIAALRDSLLTRTLSDASLSKLEQLVVAILADARELASPSLAALRTLRVVSAIAGRATYLTLLRENRGARAQLLRLCAASPWIPSLLAQAPILLDQLLDARTLYAPPDREQMRVELDALFTQVPAGDTEGAMNLLRNFRQEVTLRVAAADLVEALPLVKVSDRLTWLAEVILAKTLALVRAELEQQSGVPKRGRKPCSFGVVAYGKFGGIEMGYGSDLDLLFLHDCADLQAPTQGGTKPLPAEVWLSRLAQRVIHWLSTQTSAGRAYEVDLELRPDGRRGLTVSSLASFEQYQLDSAWTWEHQALTRARAVAGDAPAREAFERVRRTVLTRPRDAGKLRRDVIEMRERMRKSLDKSSTERVDVKQGAGGLTDIEFITQYLVLRHASAHPALLDWPDHWRQTEALVAAGVLKAGQAAELIETYRTYRGWLHRRSLQQLDGCAPPGEFAAGRERTRALWDAVFAGS
ncbi:MAG: bifunctional [glutamate--ammonia ligase]-adenylyl-L-tyrosine phosphorylase/[glutamate--ammonia-ligase] adenylyltransferase [Nevskiaceae bacterium]